jgi:ABC-type polysaccharide/polyol phosphate transport system ATPase subunit
MRSQKEDDDVIILEDVSKLFRIPHEKKLTVYENIVGIIKGNRFNYEDFWALRNINFKVKRGETLGIIGKNGCGKSTLLKIIAGVLFSDTGYVKVNGKVAPFLELGVGFQPELTAEENVRLYGSIMGMNNYQIEKKFDEIFKFAELEKFKNTKLKNFSSGMYLRLAFSTAVSTNPDILLIDEVLSVGDESFQEKSLSKMMEFKKQKKTIILVSHDYNTIKNFCETAILIDRGKIITMGASSQVIDQYHAILSSKTQESKLPEETKEREIIPLPVEKRYGTHDAVILKTELFNEMGEKTVELRINEKTEIRLEIEFNNDVINPIFGLMITRNDGLFMFGTNTRALNFTFNTFKKGEKVHAIFSQYMRLNEGIYSISPAVAYSDGTRFCDWQDDALSFSVTKYKELYGCVDLESEIKILS